VFFIEARTVHALGEGCLLYEIQQTSDTTFRVYDWDRMGLDGRPRPLHVAESLATIDFSRTGFGPLRPAGAPIPQAGSRRAHWSPVPTLLWSNFAFLRERRCAV